MVFVAVGDEAIRNVSDGTNIAAVTVAATAAATTAAATAATAATAAATVTVTTER